MNYCPFCGTKLNETIVDQTKVKKCDSCGFIDWNNHTFVSCVVVAYNQQREFLMVKLKGQEEDKVTFPGGYRNHNEPLEEAARREFFEETGMTLHEIKLLDVYASESHRLIWVIYEGQIDRDVFIENDEVKSVFFVNKGTKIDESTLRGNLTKKLLMQVLKSTK